MSLHVDVSESSTLHLISHISSSAGWDVYKPAIETIWSCENGELSWMKHKLLPFLSTSVAVASDRRAPKGLPPARDRRQEAFCTCCAGLQLARGHLSRAERRTRLGSRSGGSESRFPGMRGMPRFLCGQQGNTSFSAPFCHPLRRSLLPGCSYHSYHRTLSSFNLKTPPTNPKPTMLGLSIATSSSTTFSWFFIIGHHEVVRYTENRTANHSTSSEVMSFSPFWHIRALIAVNFSLNKNGKSKDIMNRPLKSKTKSRNANLYWSYTTANLLFIPRVFPSLPQEHVHNTVNFKKRILKADFEHCEHESDRIYMAEISLNNLEITPAATLSGIFVFSFFTGSVTVILSPRPTRINLTLY